MSLAADFHVHSNYSDGRPLPFMLAAAEEAGLDEVGFADHCNVSPAFEARLTKKEFGFNLDVTYERRRDAIEAFRERLGLTIHDAVEMDYDPDDEAAIAEFLDEANFDYAIGSVHHLDGTSIFDREHFAAKTEPECRDLVDRYYENVVALVDSGLFDVLGHVDGIERTPELRGYTTDDHRAMVADALVERDTRPEINGGRVLRDYGELHPEPSFLAALDERGVEFVPGTDSHRPDDLTDAVPALAEGFDDAGLEAVSPLA
ncbi:histidinol-phosphatase HisJ family protein [Halospeciosus flavus]|uniref:histidinol-phosphatase n=1 Tax=Halospeciosus flavus TaxID=3032283 RepID=A0ABD5Z1L5_9EURY|nr:histidinol-phosphatase HisJ family protein [Halospeciosus flavus]